MSEEELKRLYEIANRYFKQVAVRLEDVGSNSYEINQAVSDRDFLNEVRKSIK